VTISESLPGLDAVIEREVEMEKMRPHRRFVAAGSLTNQAETSAILIVVRPSFP
jgi:hypothetical protein